VELYLSGLFCHSYITAPRSVVQVFNRSFLWSMNIMAKAKSVATSQVVVSFTSLKDMAYQQAGNFEKSISMAQHALDNIAGFPEDISSEAKDELYEGYRMKFNELNPAKVYAVVNDHYVLATQEHIDTKGVEKIEIGVAYAYSYSSQEFGKLANTRPALHALIKVVREKCNTYCSNRLGDLKRAAKAILNKDKSRERTANKDFSEFVLAWMNDAAPTRLKSAKNRGDSTADTKRFNEAKVAFMTKWNHAV
jgi:hypothetical protein